MRRSIAIGDDRGGGEIVIRKRALSVLVLIALFVGGLFVAALASASGSSSSRPCKPRPSCSTSTSATGTSTSATTTSPTTTAASTTTSATTTSATTTTSAGQAILGPSADAYVRSDTPTTNYGSESAVYVDAEPVRRSYLRFDVQGVIGAVSRATLRIYAQTSQTTGFTVRSVADSSWSEMQVTYNASPAVDSALGSSGPVTGGQWYGVDVTAAVPGNGLVSLALTTTSSTNLRLDSREGANAPQLVVEWQGDPPPPPPPPLDGDPVVMAAGDIACDPASSSFNGGNGTASSCRMKYTAALFSSADYVIALGDTQYDDATLAKYQGSYQPTWGEYKSKTLPAIGNHEYISGGQGYFDYFGVAAGEPGRGYYAVDVGSWRIYVLNSNCSQAGGCGVGSSQHTWLKDALAASSNSCEIVAAHHPRFASDSSADRSNNTALAALFDLFYDQGGDLWLNGHNHRYERLAPVDKTGARQAGGIQILVVGTGGKGLTSSSARHPASEVIQADTFGVVKLTLHANGYDYEFVPEAGRTFTDAGSQSCR